MKRLTAVASLLLVPTLIVGIYGQNFKQIPGGDWAAGFWISLTLIAVTTIAQLILFRRNRWL